MTDYKALLENVEMNGFETEADLEADDFKDIIALDQKIELITADLSMNKLIDQIKAELEARETKDSRAKEEQVAEDESTIYEGEMPKFEVSEAVTVSTGWEANPLYEGLTLPKTPDRKIKPLVRADFASDMYGIAPKKDGPVLVDMYGIPLNNS